MNPILRRSIKAVTPAPARRAARLIPAKMRMVRSYRGLRRAPVASLRYLLTDRELDNFTYRIGNLGDLAAFLATAFEANVEACRTYIDELDGDSQLGAELADRLRTRPDRNRSMPFGRRLGWYAAVRLLRPRRVVETGIHDGLGSVALLRALERNAAEGAPGVLTSIDIDPESGWLIPERLRSIHTVQIGDSLALLRDSDEPVGVFVHDSDHRYEHEAAEFRAVAPRIEPSGVLISDNAHATTALSDFSIEHGLRFSFWRERPVGHFYPGAGIGLARAAQVANGV
jgi:predicted O-methyltransferase YrrM